MSGIPHRHLLQVLPRTGSAPDAMGVEVPAFADPRDWWVRSVDPATSDEPGAAHRDLSVVVYAIHADKTAEAPGVGDRVIVDGEVYDVDGQPDDYTRGPWVNPAAGLVVFVRRAEG